ncbi:hypothetical protein BKA66DRAFT_464526 [Pyrenochaeta sp. MPI-SDFR-AT-0127]|nr:hypothetical protein BKA66DRAFT_464526 [Pyrenochaeta sp. MPI-SDFR-AT-0127]
MEATLIAFRLHSFVVNSPLTFHALCQRSAILPGPSLSTITSMTFVLDEKITTHSLCNWKVAEFLSNAVLLSPNINHLTIRIMTYTGEKEAFETPRRDHENFSCNTLDVRLQHLPTWLRDALDFMLQGRFYVWQSGEQWRLSFPWPQPGNMHRFAALTPRSSRGDCTVTLLQEGSGRQVNVDLIYEWDYAGLRDRERRGLVVRLEPGGKEKLDLAVVHGGTGLIWEPSKEDKIERTTTKKANGGVGEAVWWLWRGGLAQYFQAAK